MIQSNIFNMIQCLLNKTKIYDSIKKQIHFQIKIYDILKHNTILYRHIHTAMMIALCLTDRYSEVSPADDQDYFKRQYNKR